MTESDVQGSALTAEQAAQYSKDRAERAEKMAAYRMHSRELSGALAGGAAIGYLGTVAKSLEAQNRERALQIAWDIYRDKGDHEMILKAAREIADFLNRVSDAA